MMELEYIVKQEKKSYYTEWDDKELRKCVDMLQTLEHDELMYLFHCNWIKNVMRKEVIKILFMDRIGDREERFKEMSTNERINEFQERGSGKSTVSRQELRHRDKEE